MLKECTGSVMATRTLAYCSQDRPIYTVLCAKPLVQYEQFYKTTISCFMRVINVILLVRFVQ